MVEVWGIWVQFPAPKTSKKGVQWGVVGPKLKNGQEPWQKLKNKIAASAVDGREPSAWLEICKQDGGAYE